MFKMKLVTAALGAALLFAAGSAQAQVALNNFGFDENQDGTPDILGIDQMQFATTPLAIYQDNNTNGIIDAGDTYRVVGGGVINTFLNQPGGGTIPSGLGTNYELTFFYDLNYVVESAIIGLNAINVNLDQLGGGGLNLYYDTNLNANIPEGQNFQDGTLVASFSQAPTADPVDGGTVVLTANNFIGAVTANFDSTAWTNNFFFTEDGTDFAALVDDMFDPLVIAFTDGNLDEGPTLANPSPTTLADGAEVYTEVAGLNTLGGIPAIPANSGAVPGNIDDAFFSLEDGSIVFGALPEPATLGVLGMGLLGLGFAMRRRQRAMA